MNIPKLKSLIKQKEGTKLDFKEKLSLINESEKKEFAKDVIAIANSIGGRGYLVIGIRDKTKELIGIDPLDFNEEKMQQIITHRSEPPVNIRVECIEYMNKYIGIITIFKSIQRPHQMRQNGSFYTRRGSTTDFARRDEIANMFQETGIMSLETSPLHNLNINILNENLISKYQSKVGIPTYNNMKNTIWNSLGIIHFDTETNKYRPTIGGVLLFCNKPQIYLPHCYIKIITFQKAKKIEHIFDGNIMDMLSKCKNFINQYLNDTSNLVDYIYECIVNAVLHRDYFDMTRAIIVLIGNRKIEISSPGTLLKGNSTHTLTREINHSKRNNWLYEKLLTIDDHNVFLNTNLNLKNIIKKIKPIGQVKFLNIEKRNIFKVILPGLDKFKSFE
ncbi:putative DNA binding domain-containing protein [Lutibacter sp. B2]|nr:putative DNA binding domain-containing protein [Lutibacter sp. B2]